MPRARIHLDVRLLSRARLEFRDKKRRGLGSDAVRNEHAEQLARPMVGDVEPLPFTVSRGQCDRECEGPRRICSTRRRRANRSLSGGHARDRRGIGRARRPLDRSPRPCARLLFATRFGILYSAEPGRSLQALLVCMPVACKQSLRGSSLRGSCIGPARGRARRASRGSAESSEPGCTADDADGVELDAALELELDPSVRLHGAAARASPWRLAPAWGALSPRVPADFATVGRGVPGVVLMKGLPREFTNSARRCFCAARARHSRFRGTS